MNAVNETANEPVMAKPTALEEAVRRMTTRTPEQKHADREKAMKTARKGRPLPEGKTINDVLVGQWPGDETDVQIYEALEELS